MQGDELKYIETCLLQGNVFVIFGFDISENSCHFVGVNLFSVDAIEIWAN